MKLLLVLFTEFYFLTVALSAIYGYAKFKTIKFISMLFTVLSTAAILVILHFYYINFEMWHIVALAGAFFLENLLTLARHFQDKALRRYNYTRFVFHLILLALLYFMK